MNNTMRRLLCLVLVLCMVLSCAFVLAACGKDDKNDKKPNDDPTPETAPEYTYSSWSTALGTNWNPHTWDTNADQSILGYLSSPFVSIEAKDTEEGLYQWAYEMATSITDVTAANKSDLTKYNVTLPAGKTAEEIDAGYVFEIKLNPNAKWQTGELITADDYIESMKDLLDSTMKNYRANLYYAGESAVAGGYEYYNSESPLFGSWLNGPETYFSEYSVNADGFATVNIDGKETLLYVTFSGYVPFFGTDSMNDYADAGYADAGYFDVEAVEEYDPDNLPEYMYSADVPVYDEDGEPVLDDKGEPVTEVKYFTNVYAKYSAKENMYGMVAVTGDMIEEFKGVALNFSDKNPLAWNEFFLYITGYGDKFEFEGVGLYKVDDYTIRYVCDTAIDINYFLTSCTDTWLVHQATYDRLKTEKDGQIVSTYGTSLDTTVSYGVYKMLNYEAQKQVIFVRNENWYGWEKDADGNLVSYTQFLVDGEKKQQYQTTKIVIDVMTEDVARQKFFKGELMDYSPTADELSSYATSDRLYKVDETYTMSFFFNTNEEKLKALDKESNKNSVVLSNINFRKAMSLAINRSDFVTVTQGWTPAFSLMNHLYHYDIYNDPTSSYRKSDAAMQAIVNLYGIEYGEDKDFKTLKEAHDAITGYQLADAKIFMKQACDELVAAGLYTKGEEIKIQIGWAKGALTSDDNAQIVKINQYVNAALEGSGFGTIEFEAVGNIDDRYGDVPAGKFAIGYGAWGGAAFYPFRNMQVYTDTKQYKINEAGCWDPATETLELTFIGDDGEEITDTMTWTEWGNCLIGTGKYASASNEVKLAVTALLEENFLAKYYRIPLAVTTVCSILSYKVDEYTQNYNIMYGFGGFRLMSYNYSDAEWADYVAEVGGELDYH